MPSSPANPSGFTRRHDLDWLRIIAFAILIVYHIGMYFVTWDWHVKSPDANPAFEPLMSLINPWRLPLLFFISGVALRFLMAKLGRGNLVKDRLWRLVPVIVFGSLVIVAPQTYFEWRQNNLIEPGFIDFYGHYLQPSVLHGLITPTWNHLWYVAYLLIYALVIAAFHPLILRVESSILGVWTKRCLGSRSGPVWLLVLPVILLIIIAWTLGSTFPETHALIDDWATHASSLTFVLMGYTGARSETFWTGVKRAGPLAVVVVVTSVVVTLISPQPLIETVYAWSMIVLALWLARRFLSQDGPARRYLTEAIFPYYILHQTLIVLAGYWVAEQGWGLSRQFFVILIITVSGSAIGFEITRRIVFLRPVMGLKLRQAREAR